MPAPLISPAMPPYEPDTAAMLKRWMPPGVSLEPLLLFRILARNPAMMNAMLPLGAYFLGPSGPLPLRLRETLILRTCAQCGCDYEWGVHVAGFADAAGLSKSDLHHLAHSGADMSCWSGQESTLIRAVDVLCASVNLPQAIAVDLGKYWDEATILAIVIMIGWYRIIATVANSSCDTPEAWATAFPPKP